MLPCQPFSHFVKAVKRFQGLADAFLLGFRQVRIVVLIYTGIAHGQKSSWGEAGLDGSSNGQISISTQSRLFTVSQICSSESCVPALRHASFLPAHSVASLSSKRAST